MRCCIHAYTDFDSKKFRNYCKQKGFIPNFDVNQSNKKNADYQVIKDEALYKERLALPTRFEKLACA